MRCENASNHSRDGSDYNLCDVCYWRKRAVPKLRPLKEVKRNQVAYILVALRSDPYHLEPVYWKSAWNAWASAGGMLTYVDEDIIGYVPVPEFEQ